MNNENSEQKSGEETKTSEDNAITEPNQQLDESVQIEDPPLFFESRSPNSLNRSDRTPTKPPPKFYESKSSRRDGHSSDPRSRSCASPDYRSRSRASPSPPQMPSRESSESYWSRIPYGSDRSRSSPDYRSRSRAPPSSSPFRSSSKSRVVCRYCIKKSGCMRGDQCAFIHLGAIKRPELKSCPEYQLGECHQWNCGLVHTSRQDRWHYLNTVILPPGLRISERFTTWSSMDTTRQQRSYNKVVPISDLDSSNSRSLPDQCSTTSWLEDRKGGMIEKMSRLLSSYCSSSVIIFCRYLGLRASETVSSISKPNYFASCIIFSRCR